jgi:hypothetical protein
MVGSKKTRRSLKKGGTHSQKVTKLDVGFLQKLKDTKKGDTFFHNDIQYEVTSDNHHYRQLGGKKTRGKKSTRRTRRKTSKK